MRRDGEARATVLVREAAGRVAEETRDGIARRYGYDTADQLTSLKSPDDTGLIATTRPGGS